MVWTEHWNLFWNTRNEIIFTQVELAGNLDAKDEEARRELVRTRPSLTPIFLVLGSILRCPPFIMLLLQSAITRAHIRQAMLTVQSETCTEDSNAARMSSIFVEIVCARKEAPHQIDSVLV